MLTRVALTVLAAGAVTAGASTTTLVNGSAPERAPRPPKAEAASRAGSAQAGDQDAGETASTPAADATPPPCPADVRNHGAYVSSVARGDEATGAEHGALVSAAARSDCGKPAGDDAAETDETETAADRDERAAAKAEKSAAKADRKAARESRRPADPGRARTR